jgi:hypothetical protein
MSTWTKCWGWKEHDDEAAHLPVTYMKVRPLSGPTPNGSADIAHRNCGRPTQASKCVLSARASSRPLGCHCCTRDGPPRRILKALPWRPRRRAGAAQWRSHVLPWTAPAAHTTGPRPLNPARIAPELGDHAHCNPALSGPWHRGPSRSSLLLRACAASHDDEMRQRARRSRAG